MKILLAFISVLILTGCSTTYTKPGGATDSEVKRDWYDCKAKNRTADPAMLLVDLQNAYECMEMEKGYTKQ